MKKDFLDTLVIENDTKIVFLILDGLGGLPLPGADKTELEAARTPHLDALAKGSICGLLDPVCYGITPGSGPAHFSLFGYDPFRNNVGRGLLAAAGIDFPMKGNELFARVNFATLDDRGIITDRRAGRIDTETNRRVCRKLNENITLKKNVDVFFEPVREHRALMVLRGSKLHEEIADTDPGTTGMPPLAPRALTPEAEETISIIEEIREKARATLSDEEKANMILLRGFAHYRRYKSLRERFKLNSLAIANYPMYQGIARLLGMTVHPSTDSVAGEFEALKENFDRYDFFFIHIKDTDSRGEDGNFEAKVAAIEAVDKLLPRVTALQPDVLVVTGDHSTPAALASHSWHPVPVLLSSPTCRPDRTECFGERECITGGIGRMPMVNLMALALAHAGRLKKFGA
jgi:2,3-bisphosphoglycerate-independent phosphoglycerate mutase